MGGGGLDWKKDVPGPPGPPPGMCNPLQPARSPALSEGLGGPGLDQGAPQGGQESFGTPRNGLRVPFSTLEALLSTHLGSSESSTSLGASVCVFSPQHLEGLWQVIGAVLRTILGHGEIVSMWWRLVLLAQALLSRTLRSAAFVRSKESLSLAILSQFIAPLSPHCLRERGSTSLAGAMEGEEGAATRTLRRRPQLSPRRDPQH